MQIIEAQSEVATKLKRFAKWFALRYHLSKVFNFEQTSQFGTAKVSAIPKLLFLQFQVS